MGYSGVHSVNSHLIMVGRGKGRESVPGHLNRQVTGKDMVGAWRGGKSVPGTQKHHLQRPTS